MLPRMATLPRRLSGVLKSVIRVSKGARAAAKGRDRTVARAVGVDIPKPRERGVEVAAAATRDALVPRHMLVITTFGIVVGTGREKSEFLHDGRDIRKVGRVVRQILKVHPAILVVKFRLHGVKCQLAVLPCPVKRPGSSRLNQCIAVVAPVRQDRLPFRRRCGQIYVGIGSIVIFENLHFAVDIPKPVLLLQIRSDNVRKVRRVLSQIPVKRAGPVQRPISGLMGRINAVVLRDSADKLAPLPIGRGNIRF